MSAARQRRPRVGIALPPGSRRLPRVGQAPPRLLLFRPVNDNRRPHAAPHALLAGAALMVLLALAATLLIG